MTMVRPAADARAAHWLFRGQAGWWDLVRFGPPGFEAYVRVAFAEETDDGPVFKDTVRAALATLADHTTTPAEAYAAIWEGWCGDPAPEAPLVPIPNRAMVLFAGPVTVLRHAPDLAWSGSAEGGTEPHLVWPADQAWCLACEVDEEIAFTVGCSVETARALAVAMPGFVRQVGYGDRVPLDREE